MCDDQSVWGAIVFDPGLAAGSDFVDDRGRVVNHDAQVDASVSVPCEPVRGTLEVASRERLWLKRP